MLIRKLEHIMKNKTNSAYAIKNELIMLLFIILLGASAGLVVWVFLRAVSLMTSLLWTEIPKVFSSPVYKILLCTIVGVITGILHRKFGNYPDELGTVLASVKKEKHYDYKKLAIILISAFLPLIMGASVGPEAGLAGIITALCYWISDNVRLAKEKREIYTEAGLAATLGVLFHMPLFGIIEVEEDDVSSVPSVPKVSKLLYYVLAAAAGYGIYSLLGLIFGAGMEGFPKFSAEALTVGDYFAVILYFIIGIIIYLLFMCCEKIFAGISLRLPYIIMEGIAGLIVGILAVIFPMVLFSGEEEMAILMESGGLYAPLILILASLVKIVLTNLCIHLGLKGGHFFPMIFSCVSMGFAMSMLLFPGDISHAAFAGAVIAATALGAQLKKPLAVVILLLLCFPLRFIFWMFAAAVIGRYIASLPGKRAASKSTGNVS